MFAKKKKTREETRADEVREMEKRLDGWTNVITGLGTTRSDPRVSTEFRARPLLTHGQLDSLYTQSGVAARISDLPADYATKDWCSVVTDDEALDEKIAEAIEKFDVREHVGNAIRWARHYGGAAVFIGYNDGQDPSEPLAGRVHELLGFKVFDRFDLTNAKMQRAIEIERVEQWRARQTDGSYSVIHRSRFAMLKGLPGPSRRAFEVQGWGWSIMDRIFEELRTFSESHAYAANIVRDFTQDVFKIENLSELLAAGRETEIQERFRILRLSRSILNAIIIGKEEEYEKRTTSNAGSEKILEQLERLLSLVSGIPITLLFGRSAAGLNATGENDIRQFYDLVQAYQTARLTKLVRSLVDAIMIASNGPTGGRIVPYQVVWHPLWKMSRKEEAEIEKLEAERDALNIQAQIVYPEEVALTRYSAPKATYTLSVPRDTSALANGLRGASEDEEGEE